jgi:hypothetical protein
MKSTILRVGLALTALWGGSHAGSLWRPAAGLCETPAVAQIRPATVAPALSTAPQAAQAQQLGGAAPGQPLRGMPSPMFGASARPSGQGTGTSRTTENGSLLQGDERYLRRNRREGAFIGTDTQKAKEIQVPPAVGDVRLPGANAGTTVISKPPRVNDPRLTVGFDVPRAPTVKISVALTRHLKAIPGLNPANQIEVSVAGDVATLRGVVASARDRTLAEQLVLFEPGISAVRNDLLVSPLPQNPEQLPRTAAPLTRQPARGPPTGSAAGK